jgi:Cu/Ag efflux pump CusA
MHKSWVDALLLMTSVLGALAGGAIFQWLFGLPLWATGVGAEVIRPMAAPILGGLLIADEVIDVYLPRCF